MPVNVIPLTRFDAMNSFSNSQEATCFLMWIARTCFSSYAKEHKGWWHDVLRMAGIDFDPLWDEYLTQEKVLLLWSFLMTVMGEQFEMYSSLQLKELERVEDVQLYPSDFKEKQ